MKAHLAPAARPGSRRAVRRILACLVASGLTVEAAKAVEPLEQFDVVLLEPGTAIEQRVSGGAEAMAAYVRRLGDAATAAVRAHPEQIPSAGFLVIAARPAGQSHLWLDFRPALAAQTAAALQRAATGVEPLPVKSGDVVFALRVGLWGARAPAAHAPAPQEWRAAAAQEKRKLEVDELVDRVWPR